MKKRYKLFVDESCHLQDDFSKSTMCIGYIKTPADDYARHNDAIKTLKRRCKTPTELKWNKVSRSRMAFYNVLLEYFFQSNLSFRCILVKYKEKLDHAQYNQGNHDNFYYKLIYHLLQNAYVNPPAGNEYSVYLDVKDTHG